MRVYRFNTRHALVLTAVLCVPAAPFQNGSAVQAGASLAGKGALAYNIEWRLIDAGKARLTWTPGSPPSHTGAQITLHLESTGLVSKLYKVNDDYIANFTAA